MTSHIGNSQTITPTTATTATITTYTYIMMNHIRLNQGTAQWKGTFIHSCEGNDLIINEKILTMMIGEVGARNFNINIII